MKRAQRTVRFICLILVLGGVGLTIQRGSEAWLTADQMGERLYRQEKYQAAANTYSNPMKRGVSEYRAGDFERAAETFRGIPSLDAVFNQANAHMMLGEYETAVGLYENVVEQSDRQDAKTNLEIALGRWERVKDEGGQMTGGKLGADEIVFDNTGGANKAGDTVDETEEGGMSDEQLRGLWLREVQTTPSDFLRAKFGFQLARQNESAAENPDEEGRR